MRRPRTRRLGQLERLEPRCVLDSTVVFNEIMYNPAGTTEALEFIELHNQMAINMDLSGWRLDGGVNFTFAEGTIVPGGARLVIASDPGALQTATGLTGVRGPYVGQLDNDGEQIELRDRTGRLMDQIDYRDGGDWPVAADGSGASLAKIKPNTASGNPENWTFSPQVGGTPGAQNFSDLSAPPVTHEIIDDRR